eukprot:UN21172
MMDLQYTPKCFVREFHHLDNNIILLPNLPYFYVMSYMVT